MDGLHQKLEGQGLKNVSYMVVNDQEENAMRLHNMLQLRLSENITLYKQQEDQPNVWTTLKGEKDDFFIYDRCGRLTHHISLPYSIIAQGHIERAIKESYCKRICGDCIYESPEIPEECKEKADTQPETTRTPEEDTGVNHGHGHGHGRGHGHVGGGFGGGLGGGAHGHHHGHGVGHGNHDDVQGQSQQSVGQQQVLIQGQGSLEKP